MLLSVMKSRSQTRGMIPQCDQRNIHRQTYRIAISLSDWFPLDLFNLTQQHLKSYFIRLTPMPVPKKAICWHLGTPNNSLSHTHLHTKANHLKGTSTGQTDPKNKVHFRGASNNTKTSILPRRWRFPSRQGSWWA